MTVEDRLAVVEIRLKEVAEAMPEVGELDSIRRNVRNLHMLCLELQNAVGDVKVQVAALDSFKTQVLQEIQELRRLWQSR